MIWGPKKIAEAAEEIAKVARVTENIKALQDGQKDIANAIAALSDRIKAIEIEMRALKSDTKLEAIKEVQQMVSSVQGAFNDKLIDLTVRMSHLEKTEYSGKSPIIAIGDGKRQKRLPKSKDNPPAA